MYKKSVTTAQWSSNPEETEAISGLTMRENYQRYQACAIKLHLQSEQCPETDKQQNLFDRQQREYLAGQAEVISAAAAKTLHSIECAIMMMSLWTQEVMQGQDAKDISDTDRMAVKVFEFFTKHLNEK